MDRYDLTATSNPLICKDMPSVKLFVVDAAIPADYAAPMTTVQGDIRGKSKQ